MNTRIAFCLCLFLAFAGLARAQTVPGEASGKVPVQKEIRRYLVVPVKFADTQEIPLLPTADYLNLFTDPNFGAEVFYRVSSNGRFSLEGAQVVEPVTLPKTAEEYLSTGKPWELTGPGWWSHQRLMDDLGPILEKTQDLRLYYGMVVFPNVSDRIGVGSGYRPLYKRTGDTKPAPFPMIFINPGPFSLAGLVHEIGHHLDIGHIRVADPAIKFDAGAMSFVGAWEGRVHNITCDHLMWQKELLGWTKPDEVQVLDKPQSTVVRLYPRSGDSKGLRMVKIPLKPAGEILTLEAVLPAGIDRVAGLPDFGVVAHRINAAKVTRTNLGLVLDDYLPEAQVTREKSIYFKKGDQWTAANSEMSFTVIAVTPEWCDVKVDVQKVFQHIANRQMQNRIELSTCILTPCGGSSMYMGISAFGKDWGGWEQVFGMGEVGEGVDIAVKAERGGMKEILLGYTLAPDYGIVELRWNGEFLCQLDEWAPEIQPSGQVSLGSHVVKTGKNVLSLRIVGKSAHWKATRIGYGLDCLSFSH